MAMDFEGKSLQELLAVDTSSFGSGEAKAYRTAVKIATKALTKTLPRGASGGPRDSKLGELKAKHTEAKNAWRIATDELQSYRASRREARKAAAVAIVK